MSDQPSSRGELVCRGIRGATTAGDNSRESILLETRRLLAMMIRSNDIDPRDVSSAVFSVTADLNADFPALAARQFGWMDVPLLCTNEIDVPGALGKCIRILIHWNTDKSQQEIQHIYLKEAVQLRPDLSQLEPANWDELEEWIEHYLAGLETQ